MQLQFLGAADTVTGSKYLVSSGSSRLLVDCGLFQGYKQLRLRNWARLPVDAASLSAVVLTHAHIDHSGYIPLLVKQGFRGKVYCSAATADLCEILLPDSGHLQEEEAEYANRKSFSKHKPALPLYTQADAERSLRQFESVEFDREFPVANGFRATLTRAGHILGAACVSLRNDKGLLVFTGDLGRPHDLITQPPAAIRHADWLVVESTYGNRRHLATDPLDELRAVIRRTSARGGVLVIPSFAVGRAQVLMYCVHLLKQRGDIAADLPVYLNSPMAVDATTLYRHYRTEHRLSPEECWSMCHAAKIVNSVEESRALNEKKGPMIIIAASGMATGGRVVHHLKAFAPDPANTILFSGFQAGGTRGAAMLGGAEAIKIHGQYVPVRAEVAAINSLSAHADYAETLEWLSHFEAAPRETFITHGEPAAADAMRLHVQETLHWRCRVPEHLETVTLE